MRTKVYHIFLFAEQKVGAFIIVSAFHYHIMHKQNRKRENLTKGVEVPL